ncbi:speckle-type POZ protein B-like [Daphnia magna]|nr:speckle-type POZ protein B-like [Daphnia magna]
MPFGSQRFELKQTKIPYVLHINFSRTCGEMNAQMQFINLYVNQFNCDVTFHFDTAEKDESIGGHVNILSVRSSIFAAMFQSGMQETNTRKVCIKDIKPDIFKQLLYYIYSGRTSTKLSEEIAQPLYVAADMYDIEDLKDECVQFLLSCIKLENAINLMAWAHVLSIDSIKEATLTFVESRGREICKQDDWERLIKNYPDLSLLASRRMLK